MKVFKFGGASIRSKEALRNMTSIIKDTGHQDHLVVVVSAMGKTTNALENILNLAREKASCQQPFNTLRAYHLEIAEGLFDPGHPIFETLEGLFTDLMVSINTIGDFNWHYDQVVCFGEVISATIVAAWMQESGLPVKLIDARKLIMTSYHHRNALVDWEATATKISNLMIPVLQDHIVLTQGFIGGHETTGNSTTLGREGSDYTGAILASILDAASLTIWKDVPGVLNTDPKIHPEAVLYKNISYREAAEMTYYGASVIHPKTIKPLANKNIPLYVRSFEKPFEEGTLISDKEETHMDPAIIYKRDQCLFSFKVVDFTFIHEGNLSKIFEVLAKHQIHINIMQNSAISFSICFDYDAEKTNALYTELSDFFEIYYNTGLTLITIKNYDAEAIEYYGNNKSKILEQKTRANYRVLIVE